MCIRDRPPGVPGTGAPAAAPAGARTPSPAGAAASPPRRPAAERRVSLSSSPGSGSLGEEDEESES
eukprot:6198238-Alexandrium_andersonii.AAC.1